MTFTENETARRFPVPADEAQRLEALAATGLLDTPAESNYDDIVSLAARLCDTPIALVTLIDRDRQWFKASVGVEIRETPRSMAFCNYPVAEGRTCIIRDTAADPRFRDNPFVAGDPHIRFYAGAPLMSEGHALGSLCVIDFRPRELAAEQIQGLEALSRQVMREIQMRGQLRELRRLITERQVAQEAIHASESVLRSFYDSSPFMMGVVELRGEETFHIAINRAALDFTGVKDSAAVLNRSAADVGVAPEIIRTWVGHYREALRTNAPVRFEYEQRERVGKGGRGRAAHALSVTVSPIGDAPPPYPRFSYMIEDVTDRKKAEEELREAKEAAQHASASKSQFLANMSHEIRTPLTAILGYADLLEDRELGPAEREAFVQTIRRNGRHLLKVINDILDLSKIEADKVQLEQVALNLRQLVGECVNLVRGGAEEKKIQLEVAWEGPLPEIIYTDPTRVRQILMNLLGNAVKFTSAGSIRVVVRGEAMGGEAHFSERRDVASPFERLGGESAESSAGGRGLGARVIFDVIDTGIGLRQEQLAALFQPFTQADATTTRKFGGTGLGLVISRRLAQMLGGELVAASKVGRGSTFTFWMPLRAEEGAGGAAVLRGASPMGVAAKGPPLNARILLAEDGVDNQILLQHVLRRAGARVTVAENGRAAVEKVMGAVKAGEPFDLILMDMQMPELDGYDAARLLREAGVRTPIVALTANAMEGDRERCLAAGCDDFATKPIDMGELVGVIRRRVGDVNTKSRRDEGARSDGS